MADLEDLESGAYQLEINQLTALYEQLKALREQVVKDGKSIPGTAQPLHDDFRLSAINLLHYLSLRRHDLRDIQTGLVMKGLSSLNGAEPCVLASLNRVLGLLKQLLHDEQEIPEPTADIKDYLAGQLTLEHHTNALLGPNVNERGVRIMVTMPSEAASDYRLIHDLLQSGMDCMRINCAHDGPEQWLRMIDHLRRAEKTLGRSCRVAMDLAGPKLRTGPIQAGPEVAKVRPLRNDYGWVVKHYRVLILGVDTQQDSAVQADLVIRVESSWLARLQAGDVIVFRDARGAKRSWKVVENGAFGVWLEGRDTAYIANGQLLTLDRDKSTTLVGGVAAKERGILLYEGDRLMVRRNLPEGAPATYDSKGQILSPAVIGCTLPACLDHVREGEAIWFDDGKIGGVIESVDPQGIKVRITRVRAQGRMLRGDKGINLPESKLAIDALTDKDREDIRFIAQYADIVALSFVGDVDDVEQLKRLLLEQGSRQPGIVLKVETRRAFVHLPKLLLAVMSWPSAGVMIARGDLAVECGFERLAEVQEEILWLCEAAHVPVIWATQVLETLAKEGLPSRAEITDAAMGHRAECVMLNKGPHILRAVAALDDILQRMQQHQTKKRSIMRRLQVAMFNESGFNESGLNETGANS